MKKTYISTRNLQKEINFYQAIVQGIGDDGGLLVPQFDLPVLDLNKLLKCNYVDLASEIISVFVPYKTEEAAKAANPEYFELLNKLVEDEKIYYYYCPKLEGNLCSDYENRPSVCKDFPHNPLKLLPSACSYNEWKQEIAHEAMLLKAKTDIIEFYRSKLQ